MSGQRTLTIHVPLLVRKRGGQKIVVAPDGVVLPGTPRPIPVKADPTLLKALARAFRWRKMLDEGHHASVSDIARSEKLDRTYVGDLLRLTLLAPCLVEAIVDGSQPLEMTLPDLMAPRPAEWTRHLEIGAIQTVDDLPTKRDGDRDGSGPHSAR